MAKVYSLPSCQKKRDSYFVYSESHFQSKIPIIIDNGSYQCKAGWASEEAPNLVFKNHIVKHRGKKENEIEVGNDIKNIEVVRWLLKTQFDKNVVTQFDVQELVFDHIFSHLGINSEKSVNHPIVMTEPVCNPSYSRQLMSELLFECYQVPQVAYGIDSLYSFHYNNSKLKGQNGLILSLGYHASHVIPYLNQKMDIEDTKRINVGGQHMVNFFHRLLQLKYPVHASAITLSRCENLMHQHMFYAHDYFEDIKKWDDENFRKNSSHKVQLPYISLPGVSPSSKVSKIDKCHSLLRRVQALRMKQRAEKLAYDEERLQEYFSVQEVLEDDEAILALQELGFTSATELQAAIKKLNCSIQKTKNLILSQQDEPQDSPLSNWCEELSLKNFSDADGWIAMVKQKRNEVYEARQKLSEDNLKNGLIGGFSSTTANDLFGGIFGDSVGMQSFQEYKIELEEKKDQLQILDEILAEYDREFSKSEPNFSFNLAEYYQLHLDQEMIRVPEVSFQPFIIGVDQGGLAENIDNVLCAYDKEDQQKLTENVFITGGCAKLQGILQRVHSELLAMRPFHSKFNISIADDPVLDAWKGARKWAMANDLSKISISRAEYQEKGGDYLKEHAYSNHYYHVPAVSKSLLIPERKIN